MADSDAVDKMLDELLKGKKAEEIFGEGGLAKELTRRLVERALQGEMTAHLGYEKHAPEGPPRSPVSSPPSVSGFPRGIRTPDSGRFLAHRLSWQDQA
jgi:hypothetical protein